MQQQQLARLEPVFVTGTGTDVGKTYVTALLCRALNEWLNDERSAGLCDGNSAGLGDGHNDGISAGLKGGARAAVRYYKAAISGSNNFFDSDASFVIENAGLDQNLATATSYLYREPVSPHLAYCNEVAAGNMPLKPSMAEVLANCAHVHDSCTLTVLEGSGGIYCPLWCSPKHLSAALGASAYPSAEVGDSVLQRAELDDCCTICDFMHLLARFYGGLKIVVVADAKLGCINEVLTTLQSLKHEGFDLNRVVVILNHYDPSSLMQRNNVGMIESLTKIPVVATVQTGQTSLELTPTLRHFFSSTTALPEDERRSLFQISQGLKWWPKWRRF